MPSLPEELIVRLPHRRKALPVTSKVDFLYSLKIVEPQLNQKFKRFHLAFAGPAVIGRSLDSWEVLENLESDLRKLIAELSRKEIFVHAGVVEWKRRGILIPGASHSGKSTLIAEFVKAGATYYSDEYAILDPRGRVLPYANLISLRGAADTKTKRVHPSEIGGAMGSRPLPITTVLLTKFKPAARWRPRRISQGKGLLRLLSNTVQARRRPKEALQALRKLSEHCCFFEGPRGEAETVVAGLADLPHC